MRFKCQCAYDGTPYNGWQSQVGGNTVQDILEKRLAAIFKQPIRIHGSGRTDAGVHAKGQIFHFDADWQHPTAHLHRAFGSNMPDTIQVSRITRVNDTFHARFSAKGKRYTYTLYLGHADPFHTRWCWSLGNRKPDLQAMQTAAQALLGKHNFAAFAARRNDGSDEHTNTTKDLRRLDVTKRGKLIRITTEADGYLYKMVRTLTGALLEVGLGKLTPDTLTQLRNNGIRTRDLPTAPALGLCLDKVFY